MSMWANLDVEELEPIDSAINFPTKSRFHIALNVKNLAAVSSFYKALFGNEPITYRDGYAKFDVEKFPLLFSLNEVPHNAKGDGYFGFEVKDPVLLTKTFERLHDQGSSIVYMRNAEGSRLQVADVEGNNWEFFCRKARS